MHSLRQFWTTSSLGLKLGLALIIVAIPLGVHYLNHRTIIGITKQAEKLKEEKEQLRQEGERIAEDYSKTLGERDAYRTEARQLALDSAAYRQESERRGINVKKLDDKITEAKENYAKAKDQLGDCATVDECNRRLCAEYAAAGIKLANCPK